ncbi:hypothetical protein AYI69_g10696, partial [Smittium culicis]
MHFTYLYSLVLPLSFVSASFSNTFTSLPNTHARKIHSTDYQPRAGKSTIIDALSSDIRYSKFIHYLQRLHLIIPFNKLDNVTVLAPTNDAFLEHEKNYRKNYITPPHTLKQNLQSNSLEYFGITKEQLLLHVIKDGVYGASSWVNGMVWESISGWHPSPTPNNTLSSPNTPLNSDSARQGIMLKTRIDNKGKIY